MKSILISIKPKWVAKILNGEKTIEIRKTMPKCDLPIDVYIYCTKDKEVVMKNIQETKYITHNGKFAKNLKTKYHSEKYPLLNGKVVAKFTLNRIDRHHVLPSERIMPFNGNVEEKLGQLCLTKEEVMAYGNGEDYYAYLWHISNLVIFDEPKELSEFKRCTEKTCIYGKCHKYMHCLKPLTKAPQSFAYIEIE